MVKTSQPIHYALLLPICLLLSHYEGGHLPYVSYILYSMNSASHSAHSSQHAKARGELSKTPLSVWHSELMREQRADSTLKMMFQSVLPADEVKNHAQGYLIQNKVLLRKWVRHSEGFVGHPVLLRCNLVLHISHDESGHMGTGKMYNLIWRLRNVLQVTSRHSVS